MPITNSISELMKEYNYLLSEKKQLEKQLSEVSIRLKRVHIAIKSLSGLPLTNEWGSRAINMLELEDRPLRTNEIIAASEDDNTDAKTKRRSLINLSVTLGNLCKSGKARKIIVRGVKGHFYALPGWFNKNNLKPKYAKSIEEFKKNKMGSKPVIMK